MFKIQKGNGFILVLMFALVTNNSLAARSQEKRVTGQAKHLLLDSRFIDNTQNAKLALGEVKKHPSNPLFGEDKPWEARFDNLYANVMYDQQDNIYKCWYSPYMIDYSPTGMTPEQRKMPYSPPRNREMGVCYATSKDGIKWDKPELGIVDFNGSFQESGVTEAEYSRILWILTLLVDTRPFLKVT